MIDSGKLKLVPRIVLDTSVLVSIRNGTEATSGLCRALWAAAIQEGNSILIPAPALAEFMSPPPHTPLPHQQQVEVVSFDEKAAELLAKKLLPVRPAGQPKLVFKYDALIIACGLRHRANCLVSLDDQQRQLAASAGLVAHAPSYFEAPQMVLGFPLKGVAQAGQE